MICEQLKKVKNNLPENVCLIAVSKTKPVSDLQEAYHCGQRHFGENKVQEMCDKAEQLPSDIHWHLIGHLQTNKVKYIAPFVDLIHSVDSLKLLQEINKQAEKNNRIISVLLQFHIAEEETKFGLDLEEASTMLESTSFSACKNIDVCGVMGMASFVENEEQVRSEFRQLKSIFNQLKVQYFADKASFSEISMGMSGDYQLAIAEGSTMVRVGSTIFGGR